MGAGFHSIGRGTPGSQVTQLTDNVATEIVPTPPAGIARVIGAGETAFAQDVGGNVNLHNPDAVNALDVNFSIVGPDGTFQVDAVAALAAEGSTRRVLNENYVLQNGETMTAQIPGTSASSLANIVASWADYRMDDVLKLNRVVFDSDVSVAFQDLVPEPPAGSRHTLLGPTERASIIVGSAEGTLNVQFRFNDNGTLVPMGTQTPTENVATELSGPPDTVSDGQKIEAAAVDGSAIAYISYLKVPANP